MIFALETITDLYGHLLSAPMLCGLITEELPTSSDSWALKPWTASQEKSIDGSVVDDKIIFDDVSFTLESNIKGFYIRHASRLIFTDTLDLGSETEFTVSPQFSIINVS
ncbi:MAG: hypothetical protein CL489_06150 [Acidobacteria bacterium]|nr:hypothetical protein [Acidobacteriota bacterium]|tara:strand:+ start:23065 stop:23391 length:327 start_codon:yes stop_codon:yes gene_type:complete